MLTNGTVIEGTYRDSVELLRLASGIQSTYGLVDALHQTVRRCTGYRMLFEGLQQATTDVAEQEADRTASK